MLHQHQNLWFDPFRRIFLFSGRASQRAAICRERWPRSRPSPSINIRDCGGPRRLLSSQPSSPSAPEPASRSGQYDHLPQVIPTSGVPIHLYADEIEPEALAQVKLLAESPIPVDHVAVMPDAHLGKGVTIGTVFASEKYVCPNAVGVDIGCGVAAVPIHDLRGRDLSDATKSDIFQRLKERVPTGFSKHRGALPETKGVLEEITEEHRPTDYVKNQLSLPRVTDQLGTLGGGNHFLEIVRDEGDQVWTLLHSGSRNIGNRVAQHYDGIAKRMLQKEGVNVRALKGIHYMPIESQEGQDYLRDMEWSQAYAFRNRAAMQRIMSEVIGETTGREPDFSRSVNVHHNYCQCEDCGDGRRLYVTRKGATAAVEGQMGIVPGSMGAGSYITRGRGDPRSWSSSSHGAGRRMSRTRARAEVSQEEFEGAMTGVVCDAVPAVRDEAPQAYKDLTVVMEQQSSLTEIVHRLLPLINVKGFEDDSSKKKRKGKRARSNQKQRK
ncbi:hypothetical protein ACHAWF_003240 [Thalassiosira exigua]